MNNSVLYLPLSLIYKMYPRYYKMFSLSDVVLSIMIYFSSSQALNAYPLGCFFFWGGGN